MSWNRLAITACGLLLWLCPKMQSQQTSDQVGGRVVSARDGHPLPHATVTLWNLQSQKSAATATTDDTGQFRFDPVPAGKYRMTGAAAHYVTAAYMAHEQYATAIVTGAGLATDALELRLTPVASISGRVFDGVEPVQHANVTLYREVPGIKGKVTRGYSGQTDDDGHFEIGRLGAGRYFLSVSGTPWYAVHPPVEPENVQMPYRASIDPSLDVAYPTVFYPDALDSSEAVPIEIRGGEQITANLQMHPVHAVTLTMRLAPGDRSNRFFQQLSRTVFGVEEPVNAALMQSNGVLQFSGLAPGEYSLRDTSGTGIQGSSRTVDVQGGSTSVDERVVATGSLSVTAHLANEDTLPKLLSVSLQGSGSDRTRNFRFDDKGVADITGVPAGEYRLVFNGGGRAIHVMALSVDGKLVGDGKIALAGDAHAAVDATISSARLTVDGVVHRDGKPAAGLFVVLVPAGKDTGAELFRRDQSDLDGSFTFNNVSPGSYIVFATDDVGALNWTAAETLVPYLLHGVPLSVPANDATVVHLSGPVNAQGH